MKINDHKIAFIICTNNRIYCKECIYYISLLDIPEGYEIDVITIEGAEYITKAYNAAIEECDAKYKVYLHQDAFILNKNFIKEIINIFQDKKIGMIGFAGSTKLKEFLVHFCWNKGLIYSCPVYGVFHDTLGCVEGEYERVHAIDGMLMVTQYDLPWREDIIKGWDYYDISQSMVFLQAGYDIVVPNCKEPWMLHDHGMMNYENYFKWKEVFLEEYSEYVESISE